MCDATGDAGQEVAARSVAEQERVMFRRGLVAFYGALFALTIVATAAIPTGTASADVSQTPVTTGCPTGQPLTNIQELEAAQGHPYMLAEILDQAGNQDGFICAKQISDGHTTAVCGPDCPVVLFLFRDNDIPAQLNAQAG
jgi:hypothetical protein